MKTTITTPAYSNGFSVDMVASNLGLSNDTLTAHLIKQGAIADQSKFTARDKAAQKVMSSSFVSVFNTNHN